MISPIHHLKTLYQRISRFPYINYLAFLIIAFLITLFSVSYSYLIISRQNLYNRQLNLSREKYKFYAQWQTTFLLSEISQKGYLITGNSEYLTHYKTTTKFLISNAPDPFLSSIISPRIAEMDETILLYQQKKTTAAFDLVKNNKGFLLSKRINDHITLQQTNLLLNLSILTKNRDALNFYYQISVIISSLTSTILFFMLVYQSSRSLQIERYAARERQIRILAENVPAIAFAAQSPGILTFLNNYWTVYTSQTSSFALPSGWQSWIHPEDLSSLMSSWHKANTESVSLELEIRVKNTSGEYRWFFFKTNIYREEGLGTQWFGTMTDIHNQKTNQETLEILVSNRTAELERSNLALEQFAYIASHDLQEPNRMVVSYLQLLEERYRPVLDKTGIEFLNFAVDGANRMREMILALLEFSRAGRSIDHSATTSLSEVIPTITLMLQNQITESRTFLEFEGDRQLKIPMKSEHLVQILQNLISNGIKYQPPGQIPHVITNLISTNSHLQISVTDNGIGIDPKNYSKLFILFRRLQPRGKYPGTGIGLAIVKRLVEAYGGNIEVKPATPGTTFSFTIPLWVVV